MAQESTWSSFDATMLAEEESRMIAQLLSNYQCFGEQDRDVGCCELPPSSCCSSHAADSCCCWSANENSNPSLCYWSQSGDESDGAHAIGTVPVFTNHCLVGDQVAVNQTLSMHEPTAAHAEMPKRKRESHASEDDFRRQSSKKKLQAPTNVSVRWASLWWLGIKSCPYWSEELADSGAGSEEREEGTTWEEPEEHCVWWRGREQC